MPARLSEALVLPFSEVGCSGPEGGLSFCTCEESLSGVFEVPRGVEDDGAVGGSRELLLDGESCKGSVGSGVGRRTVEVTFCGALVGDSTTIGGIEERDGPGAVGGGPVREGVVGAGVVDIEGESNSGGRILGFACKLVISFACLKYSS